MGYVTAIRRPESNGSGATATAGSYPPLSAAVPGATGRPVIEPPVSSIRWEMLREGVEDYEYLYRLRELIAERAARCRPRVARYGVATKVPTTITSDMTTFTTDPAPIYARRAEIARAIEAARQNGLERKHAKA